MDEYLGKAVYRGELKYSSVSQVKKFDKHTKGGCPRRWAYDKVFGYGGEEHDKSRTAKDKGLSLDAELKPYLRTGNTTLSTLALKGLSTLPPPGPDIITDLALHKVTHSLNGAVIKTIRHDEIAALGGHAPKGLVVQVQSILTADGVPFVGEIDFAHSRGWTVDENGERIQDPEGTIEVGDLKFKSNTRDRHGNPTMLTAFELVRDIQMAGYGVGVTNANPWAKHVRLSHNNFPEKGGPPQKVTRLHVVQDCRETWNYVEGVVRNMRQVARVDRIDDVPANTQACDAFAGCPYRETSGDRQGCSAYRATSLDNLYATKVAQDIVGEKQMGILSNVPMPGAVQPAQPIVQPVPTTAAPTVDLRAQLAAEEAAARAQQAQIQQPPQHRPTLLEAWARIEAHGRGYPALGGKAAFDMGTMRGYQMGPNQGFAGAGNLAGIQLMETEHVYQLLAELDGASPAQPAAMSTQPVTGVSAPAQFQVPAGTGGGGGSGTVIMMTQQQPGMSVGGILPPGAPESQPTLAMPQAAPTTAVVAASPAEKPKKKRGRPAGSDSAPETAPSQAQTAAPVAASPALNAAPSSASATQVAPGALSTSSDEQLCAGGCVILINARIAGKATTSLSGYVDYINEALATRYSVAADGSKGIQDVRCVPKDSPLAFGGWQGAVRELVKADPPPPDDYHLDTFMDALNEAVADGLRVVAAREGWLYVRGVRS